MVFLAVVSGLGLVVLLWLGVWQMQRLSWKQGILATIEARIAGAATDLPKVPDPEADKYRPVGVSGRFLPAQELHVLTSQRDLGAGFRIIAAFETDTGRQIMVDRGFVPSAAKNAPRRSGAAWLDGNLHWPDEVDGFTPAPEPQTNIWYARDVAAMANALHSEPLLVVLRAAPQWRDAQDDVGSGATDAPRTADPLPLPVTTVGIPNDHLQYAITWFSLALVWAGMSAAFLLRSRAKSDRS